MPQKQLSRGVLMKRCSEIMEQFSRRTSKAKSDFNKIAKLVGCFCTPPLYDLYMPIYICIISFMINDEKCKINVPEKYIVMAFLSSFFV